MLLADDMMLHQKIGELDQDGLEVVTEPYEVQIQNLDYTREEKIISFPEIPEDENSVALKAACSMGLGASTAPSEIVEILFELANAGESVKFIQFDYQRELVFFKFQSCMLSSGYYNEIVEAFREYGFSQAGLSVSLSLCDAEVQVS